MVVLTFNSQLLKTMIDVCICDPQNALFWSIPPPRDILSGGSTLSRKTAKQSIEWFKFT